MDLSIVIPTFNKVQLLKQTLEALFRQVIDDKISWEIVVVNDGSSDSTAEYLALLASNEQNNLLVVSPDSNVGRARARNLGVRAASGKWVLFIDDDIVAPAGLIQSHLQILLHNPNCATLGYAVTDPTVVDAPHFYYLDTRGVAKLPDGPAPARFLVTQNASVPRQAFMDIGGFDEDFQAYGMEDMELGFRLEDQAGVKFIVVSNPVPQHVHHHSLDQYWEKKIECGQFTLPQLAEIHPQRMAEMKLHYVLGNRSDVETGVLFRLVRMFVGSYFGKNLPNWLRYWPCFNKSRPIIPGVYFRLMNLAVLSCYRQGFLRRT